MSTATAHAPNRLARLWGIVLIFVMAGFAVAGPTVIAVRQADIRASNQAAPAAPGTKAPSDRATVNMAGLAFHPTTVTVRKGAAVTFVNDDTAPHTVTADQGPVDSGVLDPGKRFSLTVDTGFAYHCAIHPSMTAKIVVAT
ncbi:MAG TPA: plastocyanin/azurin family copper-binding protein [Actinomycetes bacterium]|nr:plastocyanin/azurin family copper-binding protein [Actinomycetes bacterium]